MQNAVIVDTLRTPLGKRNGRLKDWHPVDLAGVALRELVARTGIDPTQIDDVIMGCVMQVGEQSLNIIAHANFVGVDHPGRAYLAHKAACRRTTPLLSMRRPLVSI